MCARKKPQLTFGGVASPFRHPGQFTQLGSPRTQVVDNAFRDLSYHCEMIDRMGLDQDAVMIIHGGGIFENDGGKPATLQRIKDNFRKLPHNVQQRLVFENDDVCYSADDLLPLCEELGVPRELSLLSKASAMLVQH